MSTIDAHQHVWDLPVRDQDWLTGPELAPLRRDFTLDDLRPQTAAAGTDATVLVQTICVPEETPEFLALAAGDPLVAGVVGWTDLASPAITDVLAELRALPGGDRLVGIPHQVQGEADRDWLLRPEVDRGLAGGPAVGAGTVSLAPGGPPRIVFRSLEYGPHRDELSSVPADAPDGPRTYSGVKCMRFYAAAGTGISLQSEMGAMQETYTALVLDSSLHVTRRMPLAGIPNRARVSPSGHMAAWMVLVGGDGYAQKTFSTRTSILDTRTGALQPSLEEYAVTKDGKPFHPSDANFWGVTFIDDEHFYATLGTGGQTYLIHGDVTTKTATTVRTNLECPSLSPDGTKIAFKKRVPGLPKNLPWRLYVLDLETMREHPVAETRSLDDQVVWSDDNNLVYSLPDYNANLYTVPADGSGTPRVLAHEALAPAWIG